MYVLIIDDKKSKLEPLIKPPEMTPTEERAGERKNRLMYICARLMPTAQSTEAMWSTQDSFIAPAPPSKPFARLHALARDASYDATTAQPGPISFRSVRSIGIRLTWLQFF